MTHAYTHDNDEEIARLYLAGETGYAIARQFGITDPTVYRALKRQGIDRRPAGRNTAWEDTEQNRRELVAAYEAGETVRSIAKRLTIRTSRVSQVLDESGVQFHPGGRLRFSDEDAAEFARAYQAGETLTQIGQRYGVAAKVVRDYLIRTGVQLRPLGAPAFWTQERKTEAIRRYQEEGEQLKDIAAAMECSARGLAKILAELGVREIAARPRGEANHNWRGGRIIDGSGYVRVKVKDTEQQLADDLSRDSYMMEHRLVMARLLGRRLLKSETVHHIDNDRQNNEPGNLQLRQGKHGKGAVFRCASCGSHDIEAVSLA